jgi:hypothetical protein
MIFVGSMQFSDDTFVATMVVPMVKKFEKYWDISSELLEIATILDPRFKVKSIEYFYGLLYDEFVADLRVNNNNNNNLAFCPKQVGVG